MSASPRFTTIREALNSLSVPELKVLSSLLPDSRSYNRKADIIEEVQQYLVGERLRSVWASLDSLEKAAVSEAVHSADGVFDGHRFYMRHGDSPYIGSHSKPSLFDLFLYDLVMPVSLQRDLQTFVPAPEPFKLEDLDELPAFYVRTHNVYNYETKKMVVTEDEVPFTRRDTEAEAQADLMAMLHLAIAGKVRCSGTTMAPSAAAMKLLGAILTGSDWYEGESSDNPSYTQEIGPIRPFAWPMLLQAAGLVAVVSGKLALTAAGRTALEAPPADTLKSIWNMWLECGFDELRRIDVIKGQNGRGKQSLTAPSKRRKAIQEALASCPVGKWIPISEFNTLVALNHEFMVTRDEWSLYVLSADYGSIGQEDNTWELLEGRYILCLLFEYGATLGLIDIVYMHPTGALSDYRDLWGTDDLDFFSRYDGLVYFRINPLGAYCIGTATEYTAVDVPVERSLRVLPNHDIVVVQPPLAPSHSLILSTYASQTSVGVWRLEQSKLLSAVDQGHSIDQLRLLLRDLAVGEMPDAVSRLLNETEQRCNKLHDCGVARLYECKDQNVRMLILNDKRSKSLCYAAGDQFIAVPVGKEKAFTRAVRELGYVLAR